MAKKAKRSAYLGCFVAVAKMDCCLQSLAGLILRREHFANSSIGGEGGS